MKRSLRLLAAVAVLFVASRYSSAQSSPAVEFNGATPARAPWKISPAKAFPGITLSPGKT